MGLGIFVDQCSYIFGCFVQVDGSVICEYGGMGFGLVICSEIVEMVGGVIGVQSEFG